MRIGHGYDVHRLVAGRELVLGGVIIPHETGLDGHSDADVLLHAICDAALGAAALRDIGHHFPDTDSGLKDISSLVLLEKVKSIIEQKNYRISNIDATIIAQRPRLAPYIPDMIKNIASVLGLPDDMVNVKATTEEGLGFTGARQGIAAHAVVLIYK
ncbi:MAG: 2-C-methyl-D-erythritol 2,4-cyclodiphosphate synthase [Firmicutes bacterium HGW-Firmicutes-21]|nr:MAG: 2-C-methyl-D-erythritol 2,4-cyclodiphosphate synthase [Firmicutes bacterium HGW-Firmicutes-21]